MIGGSGKLELVAMLEGRQTCLYHACQFDDFQVYLRLGGIPSRAYLEQQRESFTPFETDTIDQENEVWDEVFVNLSDFGKPFAKGGNCVPNPFGPIYQFRRYASYLLEGTIQPLLADLAEKEEQFEQT